MHKPFCFAALALGLAACGSDNSSTSRGDGKETASASVSSDGATTTTTIEGEDGTATIRSGTDTASDLPLDFEIYPSAQVITSTTIDRDEEKGALVMMMSDASPDEMIGFYREAAEAAGIALEMDRTSETLQSIGGRTDDGTTFSFTAVPGRDGKTQGQLMIGMGR